MTPSVSVPALHEIGHTLACLLAGITVNFAELHERGGTTQHQGGQAAPEVGLAIDLAGNLAEQLFAAEPFPWQASGGDFERALRRLKGTREEKVRAAEKAITWLKRRMTPYRARVVTAAKALDYYRRLTGPQLEKLLDVRADDKWKPLPRRTAPARRWANHPPRRSAPARKAAASAPVIRVIPAPRTKADKQARAIRRGVSTGCWRDPRTLR